MFSLVSIYRVVAKRYNHGHQRVRTKMLPCSLWDVTPGNGARAVSVESAADGALIGDRASEGAWPRGGRGQGQGRRFDFDVFIGLWLAFVLVFLFQSC